MRKRNNRIRFWLNDLEFKKLQKQVEQSGLTQEAFLRKLLKGDHIRPNPPEAYYDIVASAADYICYTEHILGQLFESDTIDLLASEKAKHLRDKFWDHIHAFR